MNIALFGDAYYPVRNGVATYMREIKKGLESCGHNVFVVSVRVPGYVDVEKNILRLQSFPVGMGTDQRLALVDQSKVLKFMRENKIDIVHTHSEFVVGRAGVNSARRLNIPVVHTLHTLWEEYSHYLRKITLLPDPILKKFIQRYLIRYLSKVDYVICPSNKSYSYLKAILPGVKSVILYNALNKDLVESASPTNSEKKSLKGKLGIKEGEKILIFVGRIGAEKRVKELVMLLTPTLKSTQTKLVLVGDGPDLGFLKESAETNNIKDSIIFTGFVPWEDVIKLYSVSDIFVSVSKSEVHPMTALEAARCGLPIIAPQDDAFSSVVSDGVNGYLLKDDMELEAKILNLLQDENKLQGFSIASKLISQKFDIKPHVQSLIEVYRTVIESK